MKRREHFKMASVKYALSMAQSVNAVAEELGFSGITMRG